MEPKEEKGRKNPHLFPAVSTEDGMFFSDGSRFGEQSKWAIRPPQAIRRSIAAQCE